MQIYAGILLFVDMRLATGSQEGWVFGPITQSYPATLTKYTLTLQNKNKESTDCRPRH
jgi:hypothetical protein